MPAPIGNKYALGKTKGRTPIYETQDEMIKSIDEYFEALSRDKEPATITGLMLSLGFATRQSFADYIEKDEFSYALSYARMRIENAYEQNLHKANALGSVFALKNMGWQDKTVLELPGDLTKKPIEFR